MAGAKREPLPYASDQCLERDLGDAHVVMDGTHYCVLCDVEVDVDPRPEKTKAMAFTREQIMALRFLRYLAQVEGLHAKDRLVEN